MSDDTTKVLSASCEILQPFFSVLFSILSIRDIHDFRNEVCYKRNRHSNAKGIRCLF